MKLVTEKYEEGWRFGFWISEGGITIVFWRIGIYIWR